MNRCGQSHGKNENKEPTTATVPRRSEIVSNNLPDNFICSLAGWLSGESLVRWLRFESLNRALRHIQCGFPSYIIAVGHFSLIHRCRRKNYLHFLNTFKCMPEKSSSHLVRPRFRSTSTTNPMPFVSSGVREINEHCVAAPTQPLR